jgi:UDP-N-acetylmuramate--alanine ligase
VPETQLEVPGAFNVDNAALALGLAIGVGTPGGPVPARPDPDSDPGRGLGLFHGTARRFEPWGEEGGIEVIHDYAHHPTEVRVTLEAARRAVPGVPLHVLFQPHQHSRTARFLDEFCESLRSADRVVVSDVYGARMHIDGERFAGAPEIVSGLRARLVDAELGGDLEGSVRRFVDGLPERAAALVLGAGDIETVREDLLDEIAVRCAERRGSLR